MAFTGSYSSQRMIDPSRKSGPRDGDLRLVTRPIKRTQARALPRGGGAAPVRRSPYGWLPNKRAQAPLPPRGGKAGASMTELIVLHDTARCRSYAVTS